VEEVRSAKEHYRKRPNPYRELFQEIMQEEAENTPITQSEVNKAMNEWNLEIELMKDTAVEFEPEMLLQPTTEAAKEPTVRELKKIAKERGIRNYSRMSKGELMMIL